MRLPLLCVLLLIGLCVLATPEVEIISIRPNKIVYPDGEAGKAAVLLTSALPAAQAVTLRATLIWDMEQSKSLPAVTVTVPAKGSASAEVAWPAPAARYGHELRVDACIGEKVVDTGRQFFGVHRDWMELVVVANEYPNIALDEWPFYSYTTLNHWFAWAPADYAGNVPTTESWYAGQVRWKQTKQGIIDSVKTCQSAGVHCTFYNNSFTNGSVGVEWARRHPEWVVRERNGQPLLSGSPFAMALPPTDEKAGGEGFVQIDFSDRKSIEWGAQNVLDSVTMFGWDGMFWDCSGCYVFPGFSWDGQATPHGQNPDALSARNFTLFHSLVRQKHPAFGVWINGAIEGYTEPFWSRFGNSGGLATMEAQLREPQTALLSEFRHHESPGTHFNNWARTRDAYLSQRDAITQRFGTPVVVGYTWPGYGYGETNQKSFEAARYTWVASNHLMALYLASQMHPATNPNPPMWAGTQFMTRYSGFLWSRDLKALPDAKACFSVTATRPVWWEHYAYRRPTAAGEELLLHLVNVPETETVDILRQADPPAASGTVTLTLPPGATLNGAWALQMRGYVANANRGGEAYRAAAGKHVAGSIVRAGPSQVRLTPKVEGGKVTVTVPPFRYHTLLVFRLEGGATP